MHSHLFCTQHSCICHLLNWPRSHPSASVDLHWAAEKPATENTDSLQTLKQMTQRYVMKLLRTVSASSNDWLFRLFIAVIMLWCIAVIMHASSTSTCLDLFMGNFASAASPSHADVCISVYSNIVYFAVYSVPKWMLIWYRKTLFDWPANQQVCLEKLRTKDW